MSGGNKVDDLCAFFLKLQKNLCQTFYGNLFTEIIMAEGMILAKYAFQAAAGKENGSASVSPADAGLFPRMESCACDF